MKRIIKLDSPITVKAFASVGGYEERRGPLGEKFDFCDTSDRFGQKTWELAEGEMARIALNTALGKAQLSHADLSLLVAGDLQNQCAATTLGLANFNVPFLGVYGACSTCTESLLVLAAMLDTAKNMHYGAAVTTSHNAAAERQFRTPLEYGGQRPLTATWTSTAGGAFILERGGTGPRITEIMAGKIVDGATSDGANMGGAMSFAAADTILSYFEESGESLSSLDYIITGDLGKVGSDILKDILARELPSSERLHVDCGMLLYDMGIQDAHSGASGCGTSAATLASHFLPLMLEGRIRDVLFLSTGALMNPQTLLQGQSIAGIAPLIRIKYDKSKGR